MDYDLLIIGAGWAGVTAAREAARAGLKVGLIEQGQAGGTCLNRGCIPAKSLIESSQKDQAARSGDLSQARQRKNILVDALRQGILASLKGVDYLEGAAGMVDDTHLIVKEQLFAARNIFIATGSSPQQLSDFPFDHSRIVCSDDMLEFDRAPASLGVIGAGALGMEFAGLFASCGSRVSVFEAQPDVLPTFDTAVSRKVAVSFEKRGISVKTGSGIRKSDTDNFERIAVCAGRQPFFGGLDLAKAGVKYSQRGISVNDHLQTSCKSIYAVGDCNGLNMQAHAAALQARLAVQSIVEPAGSCPDFSSFVIPQAVFTSPQAAGVGMSEAKAAELVADYAQRTLGFMANGMARIRDEKEGLVKVIWDTRTDRLLGAWVYAGQAAELISFFTLCLQNGLTRKQCRQAVVIHPSVSETLVEVLA